MVRTSDRLAAGGSLLVGLVAVALAVELAVDQFPGGLLVVLLLATSAALAGLGFIGSGMIRVGGFAGAAFLLAFTLTAVVESGWNLIQAALIVAVFVAAVELAREAFSVRVPLPDASAPERPVLFFNPKSGDGKAEKFNLQAEAESRGYRTVELTKGTDLRELVESAIKDGADGLAMAGGDGSQAVVAEIASQHDLPYACIPAGTRNHFALEDRKSVV